MRIFFSVGEPSGDHHAARLIREIRGRIPNFEACGFGGPKMEEAGFSLHYRLTDLAVMGFFRVIPLIWRFFKLYRRAGQWLRKERPDAVVLVDFPGFNWWIAHQAKALGIPVFYYLPPQLWAWAPWRIKRVKKNVDYVLCGLGFEQQWYRQRGVAAEHVGHPFVDEILEKRLDQTFLAAWASSGGQQNVGILPGSRNHEVAQNWPIMVNCIRELAKQFPDARFLVACFSDRHRRRCETMLGESADPGRELPIHFFVGKTAEVIEVASCCLMVSGSVSLEMLARSTPAVVIYYWSWLPGVIVRMLARCKYASLPNLIADREILPEFFPHGDPVPEAKKATAKLSSWLENRDEMERVSTALRKLHSEVLQAGSSARAAQAIVDRIQPLVRNHAA